MVQFILMFFPAFISIMIEEKLLKRTNDFRKTILNYAFYTVLNNLINISTLFITYEETHLSFNNKIFTIYFCLKFSILTFSVSILTGLIFAFLKKYFDITLKVNEKNN